MLRIIPAYEIRRADFKPIAGRDNYLERTNLLLRKFDTPQWAKDKIKNRRRMLNLYNSALVIGSIVAVTQGIEYLLK